MHIGLGLSLTAQLRSSGGAAFDPFTTLMTTLLSGATQLIAHPLEYGSMFQDRFGSTPVTESGQLVGLALDHGLTGSAPVAGPELRGSGSVGLVGAATAATYDTVTGYAEITKINLNTQSFISFPVLAQTWYTFVINVTGATSVALAEGYNSDVFGVFPVGGPTSKTFFTGSNTSLIFQINAASGSTSFTVNSIKSLVGNHAKAISDASRGVFREAGGKRWIEYNGINTAYATPALAAPGVDKAQVFAGVRRIETGDFQIIVELRLSSDTQNGSFGFLARNVNSFSFVTSGTNVAAATSSVLASDFTGVFTSLGDISGDTATIRIDGTQVAQSTADQGAGNYNPSGTYPLYYGSRIGSSFFFNGNHYDTLGPITRISAANATAAQIEAAEAYYTARVI